MKRLENTQTWQLLLLLLLDGIRDLDLGHTCPKIAASHELPPARIQD